MDTSSEGGRDTTDLSPINGSDGCSVELSVAISNRQQLSNLVSGKAVTAG